MIYLVDTHVLLWSFLEPRRLSGNVVSILLDANNAIYYSPISLWEISVKYGLKKLHLNGGTPDDFFEELGKSYYRCKSLSNIDIVTSYKLSQYHKDPFDRFLIWEAIRNGFVLISHDEKMALYKKDGLTVVC